MLAKNREKQERKAKRNNWVGYFPRVTKDNTKYTRKDKHRNKNFD